MIGNMLIVASFTGIFVGGLRITWNRAVEVTEERTRRVCRIEGRKHTLAARQWYEHAPDRERVKVRRTEFEAKLEGMKEVTELI